MTPQAHSRFRVELLVNTRLQTSETILVKEVIANGENDAANLAVHLVKKEYPAADWTNIDPWYIEKVC